MWLACGKCIHLICTPVFLDEDITIDEEGLGDTINASPPQCKISPKQVLQLSLAKISGPKNANILKLFFSF